MKKPYFINHFPTMSFQIESDFVKHEIVYDIHSS